MTDQYQTFAKTPIGKFVIKNLGLPSPISLDRFTSVAPVVQGAVLFGAATKSIFQPMLLPIAYTVINLQNLKR